MQLLGELLLDRANVKVMMRYVSDSKNLQMMMMLLKDNSRSIQFEAFHVFKVRIPLIMKECRLPVSHSLSLTFERSPESAVIMHGFCALLRGRLLRCLTQLPALMDCSARPCSGNLWLMMRSICAVMQVSACGAGAQVFVANPNKTQEITELLQHNKDKLLRYLGDFHTDKGASPSCPQCILINN